MRTFSQTAKESNAAGNALIVIKLTKKSKERNAKP